LSIKLAIHGVAGRMGRRIVALASADSRFEIVAGLEIADHPSLGTDCGLLAGIGEISVLVADAGSGFDVIIDFSTPDSAMTALDLAIAHRACFVSGTTGLSPEMLDRMRSAGEKTGVFHASNFSKGISALSAIVSFWARALPDADIEIVETHHRKKADSPSGTALELADRAAKSRGATIEEVGVFGRRGRLGPRTGEEIGVHAVRGGGVIGEHSVIFATPFESLIVEHRALSRDVFAAGALSAAAFIIGKTGFFGMQDLISTEGVGYA